MTIQQEMAQTIQTIVEGGRGILAADESIPTITKRFATINLESTEENRRAYRDMLFTTEGLGEYVSGVILFEETLGQKTKDGTPFPKFLHDQNIIPGIKVDKGLIPLVNSRDEKTTRGLDGLPERLAEYKKQGAKFAKWRAVYSINALTPSRQAILTNAENLARYAAICQEQGIVPIVEPEVLIDGDHTLERSREVCLEAYHQVFNAIHRHHVQLDHMILKPSMVISGKACSKQASVDNVACATIEVLLATVPAAVPTINFLSGGQTPEQATANLNSMHTQFPLLPWNVSFSYARALQEPAIAAWQGKAENVAKAQQALYQRAKLNSLATKGEYDKKLEQAA